MVTPLPPRGSWKFKVPLNLNKVVTLIFLGEEGIPLIWNRKVFLNSSFVFSSKCEDRISSFASLKIWMFNLLYFLSYWNMLPDMILFCQSAKIFLWKLCFEKTKKQVYCLEQHIMNSVWYNFNAERCLLFSFLIFIKIFFSYHLIGMI